MDRLLLRGMAFFGRHGALVAERELGQRFRVDVELETDVTAAATSGRLADTIDYRVAHEAVRDLVEGEPVELLETLAARIADRLLQLDGRVTGAVVRVGKRPPLDAEFAEFAVEVHRRRAPS